MEGSAGAWIWSLLAVAAGIVPAQAFSSANGAAFLPRCVPNGAVSWRPQSLQLRLHARPQNVCLHAVSMAAQGRGPKQGQKGR